MVVPQADLGKKNMVEKRDLHYGFNTDADHCIKELVLVWNC